MQSSFADHFPLIKGCLISLLVLCVLSSNSGVSKDRESSVESQPANKTIFSTEDIQEFRESRYITFIDRLSDTQFSKENRELIAEALSKAYSGIPVCSFDFALDSKGNEAIPSEEEASWIVLKSGGAEHEHSQARRHFRDTPISFIPNNPFNMEHGTVVTERKSSVTFRFPFVPRLTAPNLDSDALRVLLKLDWIADLTVDT